MTSTDIGPAVFRIEIAPEDSNGLNESSFVMTDKVTTIPRAKLGRMIGRLNDDDQIKVSRAMLVFLGLTDR